MKKELSAAHLKLTDSESTTVWQVYEQCSAETSKINGSKTAILKEYSRECATLNRKPTERGYRQSSDGPYARMKRLRPCSA